MRHKEAKQEGIPNNNNFFMSHERAKTMITIYRLYKLKLKIDGNPEHEPTPEELDAFVKELEQP